MACNDKNAFFTSEQPKRYKVWSCQKMSDTLHLPLDNIFIRFGSKLNRQFVGIPVCTNCASLVADLFFLVYERLASVKKVGNNLDHMRQFACLVLNQITIYSYGFLFNCTTVGLASESMTALT